MKENIIACNALRIAQFVRLAECMRKLDITFKNFDIIMEVYMEEGSKHPILGRFTSHNKCEEETKVSLDMEGISALAELTSIIIDNREQKQEEDIGFEMNYRGEFEDADEADMKDLDEYLARYSWCEPLGLEFWIEDGHLEVIVRFEKFSEDLILVPIPCEVL